MKKEIKFEKIYPTNKLKGMNKKQKNLVLETELEKDYEEGTKGQNTYQIQTRSVTKSNTKLSREVWNLDAYYTLILFTKAEPVKMMLFSVGTKVKDPESFEKAWNHPNPIIERIERCSQ